MAARIVVLISGSGSNLQAILDACASKELNAQVAAVFSNKPDAFGLRRAAGAGVPGIVIQIRQGELRREYDARLAEAVGSWQPDYIVLAGWMRLLTDTFLERFRGHVINLHPALPGTFPGTNAIQRAYEAWKRGGIEHSGVMVHFVPDEGVDNGPVIATQVIEFRTGESLDQFENRVHAIEHTLLIQALKLTINSSCNISQPE